MYFVAILFPITLFTFFLFKLFESEQVLEVKDETVKFDYVLYNKRKIESFISYWLISRYNKLNNNKKLGEDDILPKDIKGNVISIDLLFDKHKLETIIKSSKTFLLIYKSNMDKEYTKMLKEMSVLYPKFKYIGYSGKNVFKTINDYTNYNNSLFSYIMIIESKYLEFMFPKNIRLSHISKVESHLIYPENIKYTITKAVSRFNLQQTKIKNLTNKIYYTTYNNKNIAIINNGFWKSEISKYILTRNKNIDCVIVWSYGYPKYYLTIRTRENSIDASEIASLFGGNGTTTCAGVITTTDWQKKFPMFYNQYTKIENLE